MVDVLLRNLLCFRTSHESKSFQVDRSAKAHFLMGVYFSADWIETCLSESKSMLFHRVWERRNLKVHSDTCPVGIWFSTAFLPNGCLVILGHLL